MNVMLAKEEYIEQAHLFHSIIERTKVDIPIQEVLHTIRHELLATTKLPLAVDFLLDELKHTGAFATAMAKLPHYFSAFQTFVIQQAEDDRGRFDLRIAIKILAKEAKYRSDSATKQGSFLYQFESLCRNRLSYDRGLGAMAEDPMYDKTWSNWILTLRRQIGFVDIAEMIYVRSDHYHDPSGALQREENRQLLWKPLFGEKEGRIAIASRHKDPLLLFSALQRQLGYPKVPRAEPPDLTHQLIPQLARRLERLETRVKFLEDEQKGGIDLTKLYESRNMNPPNAGT